MAPTPWRMLWDDVNAANDRFWTAMARIHGQYLKDLRMAIVEYGQAVDPSSFDELGQLIEDMEAA